MRHRTRTLAACALAGALLAPRAAPAQGILGRARQEAASRLGRPAQEPSAPAAAAPAADPAATDTPTAGRPGEGAWANYDFVPGERVLFAEDFADERVGNFPRRLELLDGNMEVVEWQGRRWLRVTGAGAFRVPLPEVLPERFTVEFDVTLPWQRVGIYAAEYEPGGMHAYGPTDVVRVSGYEAGLFRGNDAGQSAVDPRELFPALDAVFHEHPLAPPVRVRIQADGRYVKVYLEEKRIANVPNASFGRAGFLVFEWEENEAPPLIGDLRVHAGGAPLYEALSADGRVATQGILFDTGSDRIRPESTPTLREIADLLAGHPALRLAIEGHTDDVGQPAANLALSGRRAEAVRAWLMAQGVDGARLEARGLGDTRPRAPNDSPEGRQTNRRVELVRL